MLDTKLIARIKQLLSKEPKIQLAYVLGSVVSGRVRADSDFDLAVIVDDKSKIDYFKIRSLVFPIKFPKDLDLSVVDKSSSPLFLFQIVSKGECIYQKSEQERVSFEVFVLKNYYDTAHMRKIYYSYLKDKFPYAGR